MPPLIQLIVPVYYISSMLGMVPVLHFSSSTWLSLPALGYYIIVSLPRFQGSAPGPIKFIEDTSDISETFPVHSVQYNTFADDTWI